MRHAFSQFGFSLYRNAFKKWMPNKKVCRLWPCRCLRMELSKCRIVDPTSDEKKARQTVDKLFLASHEAKRAVDKTKIRQMVFGPLVPRHQPSPRTPSCASKSVRDCVEGTARCGNLNCLPPSPRLKSLRGHMDVDFTSSRIATPLPPLACCFLDRKPVF